MNKTRHPRSQKMETYFSAQCNAAEYMAGTAEFFCAVGVANVTEDRKKTSKNNQILAQSIHNSKRCAAAFCCVFGKRCRCAGESEKCSYAADQAHDRENRNCFCLTRGRIIVEKSNTRRQEPKTLSLGGKARQEPCRGKIAQSSPGSCSGRAQRTPELGCLDF